MHHPARQPATTRRSSSVRQSKRLIIAVSPVQVRPPLRQCRCGPPGTAATVHGPDQSRQAGYIWGAASAALAITRQRRQTEGAGTGERHSIVAATDVRPKITLACQECKRRNYITRKNRRNDPDRLELKKYCPWCRCHRPHRETR